MAIPKLALAAAALGGVAFVATRKPKKKKTKTPYGGDIDKITMQPVKGQNHPICQKYPAGNWLEGVPFLKGYPRDRPGWSDDDLAMARADVAKAVASAPEWTTISDARALTFDIIRSIIAGWCPAMKLPTKRINLENYLKKSVALRWMWQTLDTLVWNSLSHIN